MAQGKTPLSHQILDQLGHMGLGAVSGLAIGGTQYDWAVAPAVAYFYGWARELKQWNALNSPSLADSAIDSAFFIPGAFVGIGLRLAAVWAWDALGI